MTRKVVVRGEIRSGRAEFADRLRRLGADEGQVAAFDARWDDLGGGVRAMSDANLRAVLADMSGPVPDQLVAEPVADARFDADGTDRGDDPALADARRSYEGEQVDAMSIPNTIDWIGTSVERAQVVHEAESARGDDARKGMLEAAQAVLQPAPPAQ